MATGGVFMLITNDGKQDRLIHATQHLKQRLQAVARDNAQRNGGSPSELKNLPSLHEIEKTHVLFTNAHFKPFAAMAYEYQKVNADSGGLTLGRRVTFSIPQFGDFFHDMACHVVLAQPQLPAVGATPAADQPLMRWCEYPGERLLEKVSMDVNGNPLDSYTNVAMNFHREFRVAPNKRTAWNRCVGQQDNERGWQDRL